MVESIGIVGGGQLGRMLTEAAIPLGFNVTVLEASGSCPAAQVGAQIIKGSLNDPQSITQLVEMSDVTTWEIEHINTSTLKELAFAGHNIQPNPATLAIIQDKYTQKQILRQYGLPVADFHDIAGEQMLRTALLESGSLIIKSRTGGYDGRGNEVYKGQPIDELTKQLGDNLYAEKIIDFERELSIIAAKDVAGNTVVYPTVETIHKNNICHTVLAPAKVDEKVHDSAQEIAHETLRHLGGAGIFAIEMFQTDQEVIINEIAPRVHNSGHFTIEACETSQFEQHIRAVAGLPLGSTKMRTPAAVMINILGTREEDLNRDGLDKTLMLPDTHPHFYGKNSRPARKIGHITVLANSIEEAEKRAVAARQNFKI